MIHPLEKEFKKRLGKKRMKILHQIIKDHIKHSNQTGEGIIDILKKAKNYAMPFVKEYGPVILEQILVPMIKKAMTGEGLSPSGGALVEGKHARYKFTPHVVTPGHTIKTHQTQLSYMGHEKPSYFAKVYSNRNNLAYQMTGRGLDSSRGPSVGQQTGIAAVGGLYQKTGAYHYGNGLNPSGGGLRLAGQRYPCRC
jgi:hypothetical protein